MVSIFIFNEQWAMSLLMVGQERFNSHHFKKIHDSRHSIAHKKAIIILEMAKKDVLFNLNAKSE